MSRKAAQTGPGAMVLVAIEQAFPEGERIIDDDLAYPRATRLLVLPIGVIPFLRDQRSMPTQDRIGCDDCGQFHQGLSAQRLAFYGQ